MIHFDLSSLCGLSESEAALQHMLRVALESKSCFGGYSFNCVEDVVTGSEAIDFRDHGQKIGLVNLLAGGFLVADTTALGDHSWFFPTPPFCERVAARFPFLFCKDHFRKSHGPEGCRGKISGDVDSRSKWVSFR